MINDVGAYLVMNQDHFSDEPTNSVDFNQINKPEQEEVQWSPWKKRKCLRDAKGNTYRIKDKLGEGGFGITYLVYRHKQQDQVVLKTLNEKAQQNSEAERFKQDLRDEATSLLRIEHLDSLHMVKIINLIELEGLPCLVMEYIEGKDLQKMLQQKHKFSWEEALNYIIPIAKALIKVHEKGVIHRDIKPANIIIKDKDKNQPVLVDFGTARSFVSDETMTVYISGGYTAPEQCLEKQQGPYTDVYSLGMVLYVLITGNIPNRDGLKFPNTIDTQLKRAITSALQENVAKRPQNIEEWLEKIPQSITSSDSTIYTPRVTQSLRNKQLGILAIIVFLVGLVSVLGTFQLVSKLLQDNVNEPPSEKSIPKQKSPSQEPEVPESPKESKLVNVYQHPNYGFQLSYPEDWDLETKDTGLFRYEVLELTPSFQEVTSSKFYSRVYVEVKPSHNQSLKKIANQARKTLKNPINSSTVLTTKDIQLNGMPAHEVIFTGKEEGASFQRRQILLVSGDSQYWLTYEAPKEQFSQFEAEAERILRSFSF